MNIKSKSTIEKLILELSFKGYANRTIKTYCYYAEQFLSNFDKDIYHISQKETVVFLKNKSYDFE